MSAGNNATNPLSTLSYSPGIPDIVAPPGTVIGVPSTVMSVSVP